MKAFYQLGIYLYLFSIFLSALFNRKAKMWLNGRKGWKKQLIDLEEGKWIWFHCASLGEFEQGRPVIEAIRTSHPDHRILLTFFSPSGYNAKKDYKGADKVMYMPADTHSNARFFVRNLHPEMVVIVKYEFWLNHLKVLNDQKVPVYVISAIFRPEQVFFKWYGHIFRKALRRLDGIFVQDGNSLKQLSGINVHNAVKSGDTRYDRVIEISRTAFTDRSVEDFCRGHHIIIAGSTWPADERILAQSMTMEPGIIHRYIIAPHELDSGRIHQLRKMLPVQSVLHSEYNGSGEVMIIDSIGILSKIYRYGALCYVGGGFGSGIHNILEAAVYGNPVIFGPNFGKFREALELIDSGGGFAIRNIDDLVNVMHLLQDPAVLKIAGTMSRAHVTAHAGATERILSVIMDK